MQNSVESQSDDHGRNPLLFAHCYQIGLPNCTRPQFLSGFWTMRHHVIKSLESRGSSAFATSSILKRKRISISPFLARSVPFTAISRRGLFPENPRDSLCRHRSSDFFFKDRSNFFPFPGGASSLPKNAFSTSEVVT